MVGGGEWSWAEVEIEVCSIVGEGDVRRTSGRRSRPGFEEGS